MKYQKISFYYRQRDKTIGNVKRDSPGVDPGRCKLALGIYLPGPQDHRLTEKDTREPVSLHTEVCPVLTTALNTKGRLL